MVNIKRVRSLKKGRTKQGSVLYWMSRDQRVTDNWALAYAIEIAENSDLPVMVVFNLVENFLQATWRQYDFMLKGLRKIESHLAALNIPFAVTIGDPVSTIPGYIRLHHVSHLIMDFDPLRIKREWQQKITSRLDISVDLVDAHNIVPCFLASDKQEYAAYTFRPKITRLLPEFLDEYPPLIKQHLPCHNQRINWEAITIALKTDHSVRPVDWLTPGEAGARAILEKFIQEKLHQYAHKRNNPNERSTSGLSPYLHFGHISAQRIALEITKRTARNEHTDAFLEELIVRKELADNFCFYNPDYDTVKAFASWAQTSLTKHLSDKRDYIYSTEQFEQAQTHDELWNAIQQQLLWHGTMSGYLRMYWAKKILEWSDSPERALNTAIYLNDKYQLDGRDPNGYAGCAWAVGGVHDRPWSERQVYGKIRFMNRAGCERKFDVNKYLWSTIRSRNVQEQKLMGN